MILDTPVHDCIAMNGIELAFNPLKVGYIIEKSLDDFHFMAASNRI
jgi:hypothetical protein